MAAVNDSFSGRLPIGNEQGAVLVDFTGAGLEPFEAGMDVDYGVSGEGMTLWYEWVAPYTGIALFRCDQTIGQALPYVWTGLSGGLPVSRVAEPQYIDGEAYTYLDVTIGSSYYVQVGGHFDAVTTVLSWQHLTDVPLQSQNGSMSFFVNEPYSLVQDGATLYGTNPLGASDGNAVHFAPTTVDPEYLTTGCRSAVRVPVYRDGAATTDIPADITNLALSVTVNHSSNTQPQYSEYQVAAALITAGGTVLPFKTYDDGFYSITGNQQYGATVAQGTPAEVGISVAELNAGSFDLVLGCAVRSYYDGTPRTSLVAWDADFMFCTAGWDRNVGAPVPPAPTLTTVLDLPDVTASPGTVRVFY